VLAKVGIAVDGEIVLIRKGGRDGLEGTNVNCLSVHACEGCDGVAGTRVAMRQSV